MPISTSFIRLIAGLVLLPVAAVVDFSCSKKLDLTPETTLTDASYWKTSSDLLSACNTLYLSLPVMAQGYQDNYSDMAYGASPNSVSDGSRIAPATASDWDDNYTRIRRCNTILEKSPGVSGDTADINKAKGEALFFRAYSYFELLKRYGGVPLILRTFDINDTLTEAHRSTREAILQVIYSDLNQAVVYLPGVDKQPAKEYGRITSGAASAFLSRVALFEGTREKFFKYGDYTADLTIAVNAANAVMSSGRYSLYKYSAKPDSSYFYLFQLTGDGAANKENILVRLYGQNVTNSISYSNISREEENAYITPTRSFMDSYLYKDGLPVGQSSLEQPQTDTRSEFQNRDPRMGMTVFNQNLWYVSSKFVPNFDYTVTGYKVAKWFNATDWNNKKSYIDFAIIRYAEVLLNYAEAKFELNGSIDDADLDATINLLRSRAGSNGLTLLSNAFVTANGLSMQTEIRRERTVELAFEGFRYWDLLRWKTAEVVLPKVVLGIKYFATEMPLDNPVLSDDGFVVVQAAAKRSFNVDRDYLWPIPTSELGYNSNLDPNPNW